MEQGFPAVDVQAVGPEEGQAILDETSQRLLGVSGEEFVVAWERGDYRGDDRLAVMKVAMLLPFAR